MAITDITNSYGSVDIRNGIPKHYRHVPGKRLTVVCRANKIPHAVALVGFCKSGGYHKPHFDGVIVHCNSLPKLQKILAEREARAKDPKTVAKRVAVAEKKKQREQEQRRQLWSLGIDPDSRTAAAYKREDISEQHARLIQYRAYYRHEHTDYEQRFRRPDYAIGETKEDVQQEARELRVEHKPTLNTVAEYLDYYDLNFSKAEALAAMLQDPLKAHPTWFAEACLALEVFGQEPTTYQDIVEWISCWRSERET